jgi:peptidyl-prolyl cis-trans isomerase SurA
MRYLIVILPILWTGCQTISSTSSVDEEGDNPVLFTVGDSTVHAEEFVYVYKKNNERIDSAFTQNDIADYLRLYEDFKVKIMEAYARGYDTLKEYKDELRTYTEQLKEPYLTETKITDDLIKEAYERTLEEIRASHILIRFPSNPTPEDTLDAYRKIEKIYEMALEGQSFDSLAIRYSEDPSAKTNQGDLGYFTSMQMVYPFESAAFSTMENQISPIVRTRFGYHIIKVKDRRPANGTVVVSHIMLRNKADSAAVRNRIFEIHEMATGGIPWNQLVKEYSEDTNSKEKGGMINPFGVGQAPLDFQEAAFALTKPGEISDPVNTR